MRKKGGKNWIACGIIFSLLAGMFPVWEKESVMKADAANKPTLTVSYDEVAVKSEKLKKSDSKNYTYSAIVKNHSKTGTVKKVQFYYQIQILKKVTKEETVTVTETPAPTESPEVSESPSVSESPAASEEPVVSESPTVSKEPVVSESPAPAGETAVPTETSTATPNVTTKVVKVTEWVPEKKTVVLTAKKIAPGKSSERVSCKGDYSGKLSAMKLTKVKLYAGEALYTYNAKTKKGTTTWGTKDKKAPVFSGWIGKQSIYSGVTIRVCYTDRKSSYTFKDHVKATDDRDGKVSFKVDTSKINWDKDGIYKVYYTAKDKAGNEAKAWAKVQVYKVGTAESIADEVLRSITKTSWSDEKKARAIYRYVKGHSSYTDSGSHTNWKARAVDGIRYQRGDCFTFYSMARLLLTRAGIPNLEVTRYPGRAGYHHWWSLVYVKGGWYHLDTTPRRRDGKFCLVTYAQLLGYSSGGTFRHREDILPKEATKTISPNP